MPTYAYTAINESDKTIKGTVDANDRTGAIESLSRQGLRPISLREESLKDKIGGSFSFGAPSVKTDNLVMFTRQLSAMVSAGVPLLRAISSLGERSEDKTLKAILESVRVDIEAGQPLADALEKFPESFSDVYVNMVRAGEAAGILDDILKRLAIQQEKSSSMKKKIKSAMTYPVILVIIAISAFFGLMIFVIPKIGAIVKDIGGDDAELPGLTQFMMGLSSMIVAYWYIVIPILVAAVYMLIRYTKTPAGRRQFHSLVLKIPGVNSIVTKVAVARFSRTFSSLMGAGVGVLESLTVTARAVGNALFEDALIQAAKDVENGATLSSVIEQNDLFPAIVAQMLNVGEETGQTDTVLVKVAEFYEEETDLAIDGISALIEPAMIVFMGGMVGVIAASVMLPIANLSSQVAE